MNPSSAALLALRAFRSSSNGSGWTISRSYATTSKQQSAAKPTSGGGGTGSKSSTGGTVEAKNYDPPSHVFKQVEKDPGPGASKQSNYKNPEYFSYHNMSYSDMDIVMAKHRVPQPSNSRK